MKLLLYCFFGLLALQASTCKKSTTETETPTTDTLSAPEAKIEARSADKTFICQGNEPFWNVAITAENIVYHRMGEEKVSFPYVEPQREGDSWIFQTEKSGANAIKVTVLPGECMDSMSGEKFNYSATVEINGETLKGCASES